MMQSEINSASHWIALLKRETDCPICLNALVNPLTTSCYHTFCRACINRVLKDSQAVCPLCKKKITRRGTTANARVKSLVQRVNTVVNAFRDESGVDVKCHRGDTPTPLKIRHYEEKEKGKNELLSPVVRIENICLDEVRPSPSAVKSEKASGSRKEANQGKSPIEESQLDSPLLSDSFNDLDHMSISQNVQADKVSSRKKSPGGLSMSLMKNKPLLPVTVKSPEKKVKEWLNMDEIAPVSLNSSSYLADTPLNGKSNRDRNDCDRLSHGKTYGKRVYGNARNSRDSFTYPSKVPKSKKSIVISDDEDGDEIVPTSDAGDMIPDSCPVEMNDTFDKLLSGLREKTGNKKDPPPKGNRTPKKTIVDVEKNDITLFDSLPPPVDKDPSCRKKFSFSPKKDEDNDEDIIHKRGFNSESRLRKKRKLYSGEGMMSNVDKKGKTSEDVKNDVAKDNVPLHSESNEGNLSIMKDGLDKHGAKLGHDRSKSPRSKIAVVLDAIDKGKGNKSTPNMGRRRSSDINVTCPSPGWSRLRSTRNDFQSKKKITALPALNVSGGDPCYSSSTRHHSARKSFELCKDDLPMSIASIDDDGSSIAVPDGSKQNTGPAKAPVKDSSKEVDKEKDTSASTHVVVHDLEVPAPVLPSATPDKNVGSRILMPRKATNTPSSKLCTFLKTPKKPIKETTPSKEGKSGISNSCTSPAKFSPDATKVEPLESIPMKTPSESPDRHVLKQSSNMLSLRKSPNLDVPDHVPSPQKPLSTSHAKATPVKVSPGENASGIRRLEESCDAIKNPSPLKVCEGSGDATLLLVEKGEGVVVLEASNNSQENEAENSHSPRRKIKSRLSISDENQMASFKSPRRRQNQKITNPILVERKTFSLETSTEDLSELAHLRESTEEQLEGFKTTAVMNSPGLVHDCQRNRSLIEEKKSDIIVVGVNKSVDIVSMNLERENSKHFSTVSLEKSLRKKSLHKKTKQFVPVIKMGRLNKKGAHSGQRVRFYVLGNIRRSSGTVKTSDVGVDTGLIVHQNRLYKGSEELLEARVDVGVQTVLSPRKSESSSLLEKDSTAVGSNCFNKSILISPLHGGNDENYNSLANVQGEGIGFSSETNGRQFVHSEGISVSPTFNVTHGDWNKGLSMYERSSRKLMSHVNTGTADQDIQYSVGDSSLELIPDTERSGFKVKGVQNLRRQQSHLKQKPLGRNSSAKKAVCQLFSNNEGILSDGEIALPLACTQVSKAPEETNSTKVMASRSKEKEISSLSLDSTSDHEDEEIERNMKKMRSQRSQRKCKLSGGSQTTKFSPIQEEHLSQTSGGASNPPLYGEDLDSEEMDKKLKLIVANIEADMNIRKGKKSSSEGVEGDYSVTLKDMVDDDIMEVPIDSDPFCPSVVPETNPLPLTCVEESESEHEEIKDDNAEKEKEGKSEEDALKDISLQLVKDCSGEESDFFIEGSQKEVVTVDKPVAVQKPPISLVTSGLQMVDLVQVKRLVQMFNLQFSLKFCAEGNPMNILRTTHVVTKTDDSGRTGCTFKYLCGVVTGCWVVSIQWVSDCLKAGKLLDEEPYEVLDDSGHSGPSTARKSTTKLFKDLEFYCQEPILGVVGQMKEIVELGGGKVVSSIEEFSEKKGFQFIIIDASANEDQEFFTRMLQRNLAVVTSEWIAESIGQYKLQPLVGYVVNLNPSLTSYSQHREALLSMGYNEDILGTEDDQMAFMRDEDDEDIDSCTEEV